MKLEARRFLQMCLLCGVMAAAAACGHGRNANEQTPPPPGPVPAGSAADGDRLGINGTVLPFEPRRYMTSEAIPTRVPATPTATPSIRPSAIPSVTSSPERRPTATITVTPTITPTAEIAPTPTLEATRVISETESTALGYVQMRPTENGADLLVNGEVKKIIAVNRYNLLTEEGTGCGSIFPDSDLKKWAKDMKALGVGAVRFWAFQDYMENGYERMDEVLDALGSEGMYAIPVIGANQWGQCNAGYEDPRYTMIDENGGKRKSSAYFQEGYKVPNGTAKKSDLDHMKDFVEHYIGDPRIAIVQIGNELESSRKPTPEEIKKGRNEFEFVADPLALKGYADDVVEQLHDIDPDRIYSLGTMGGGQLGTQGEQFRDLHENPKLGAVEVHDYDAGLDPSEPVNVDSSGEPIGENDGIRKSMAYGRKLQRIIMVGELGIDLNQGLTPKERAQLMGQKIDAYFTEAVGADIVTIWSAPDVGATGPDGFDFGPGDPMEQIIKEASKKYNRN